MATIEVHVDSDRSLTIFTVRGEMTAEELLEKAGEFYVKKPTKLVLWDATQGSVRLITSSQFQTIARTMKRLLEKRSEGRTAFVGDLEVDYGLGRMYEALAKIESLPIEYRTFRSIQEARQWLGIDEGSLGDDTIR